jgi:hypothetical protein
LKALRASAEAAVLAKHDVDHNCLCQPILAKSQASTIEASTI